MEQGEDILIQTPYIICGKEMYQDLSRLCGERNVRILTNAVENGANPCGCADYLNQKSHILATGATICEFVGGHSLHAKAILIDDIISVVGSFNMDMRSAYLDTEMMLCIESQELNAQLWERMETQMEMSRLVSPDGSVELGESYVPREMGVGKRLAYGLLRVLILPDRHLL